MKNALKLLAKLLSWILVIFIILTLIIAITKLSNPRHIKVDISGLPDMEKEIHLRRYGESVRLDSFSSFEELKNQVIDYYRMLFSGDLGWTYDMVKKVDNYGNSRIIREQIEPVDEILKTGFKRSIKLLSISMVLAILVGILKGVFDSKKEKKDNSTIKLFTTIIGLSIPAIFLVPLLQFAMLWLRRFGIEFPIIGHETYKQMILPIIVLTILPGMYVARITAVAVDKAYENQYVRTAISKGSSKFRVLWIHVFRNAIVEIVGSLPAILTLIISDLVIVEYLFQYQGITYLMIEYHEKGQSDVVTGFALILFGIFIFLYIIFKLFHFILDARRGEKVI